MARHFRRVARLAPLVLSLSAHMYAQAADAPVSPAAAAYLEVTPLRDRNADVVDGTKPATPAELRAVVADLDAGLAKLDTPEFRGLAEGNVYLRYRRWNFLPDRARVLARLGDTAGAIAALDAMSRMTWKDPRTFGGPDGAPGLRAVPQDPRAAAVIDARTFSAAEDTAAAFRAMKRGIVVGMPSSGSTGQPVIVPLPGGGRARICTRRDQGGDGADFVGAGARGVTLSAMRQVVFGDAMTG